MILDFKKYLGPCACGRDHELRTKLVVCEYGALKNFDKYMKATTTSEQAKLEDSARNEVWKKAGVLAS